MHKCEGLVMHECVMMSLHELKLLRLICNLVQLRLEVTYVLGTPESLLTCCFLGYCRPCGSGFVMLDLWGLGWTHNQTIKHSST